jgi:hypothetical protein
MLGSLRAGDLVEVRSREEILATLDRNGRLEGLPFMPQMLEYCGRQFTVVASAHKTCDVVAGEGRRLHRCVHLDVRCDGKAYGGCQAACLVFWKEDWLKPLDGSPTESTPVKGGEGRSRSPGGDAEIVWRGTRRIDEVSGEPLYICQATEVPYFTAPLAWWDPRQYLDDLRSGNVTIRRALAGLLYQTYSRITQAWRPRVGRPGRWIYDRFQRLIGGVTYPIKPETLPAGAPNPMVDLDLQPGELVRIKDHDAILATLSSRGPYAGMHRGLLFDKEMVPFCGRTVRVRARVDAFVDERTGKLRTLKTPAVTLEGVWCTSRYSNKKMLCPRAIPSWWREVWLERVGPESADL